MSQSLPGQDDDTMEVESPVDEKQETSQPRPLSERIEQIHEIERKLMQALQESGRAIGSLGFEDTSEPVEPAQRTQAFQEHTKRFMSVLEAASTGLRKQVLLLERDQVPIHPIQNRIDPPTGNNIDNSSEILKQLINHNKK